MVEQMIEDLASHPNPQRAHPDEIALALLSGDMLLHKHDLLGLAVQNPPALDSSLQGSQLCFLQAPLVRAAQVLEQRLRLHSQEIVLYSLVMPCVSAGPTPRSAQIVLTMITSYHDYMETYASHIARKSRDFARVVAQFRSGHGPIPVLFECYRIRTDSGMPRLDIRFSTSHLMMASTR